MGHKNKAVIDALCRQCQTLPYIVSGFAYDAKAELGRLLAEVMPPGLSKYFYSTSGTEANEAAFKIARAYTGRHKIVSRYRSYHGSTGGSVAATGDLRRWLVEPEGKIPGVVFAPEAYCYRCPFGLTYPGCGVACAEYVDHMIRAEGNVGAVIVEPVVGTNGVIVPPAEYLPRLREITRETGVLLIADEVMSGWGRVGEWFAVNHWKVVPDLLTTAKGVTGAYAPLGVTAASSQIAEYFEEEFLPLGHTYEAHPMTVAPAVAAVKEYRRLNLIESAREKGNYLGSMLKELQDRHASIGDVRGLGMFWAVELVKNRSAKKPFNSQEDKLAGKSLVVDRVTAEMMGQRVYVLGWVSHLLVAPPLIASREELEKGVVALDAALTIADREVEAASV